MEKVIMRFCHHQSWWPLLKMITGAFLVLKGMLSASKMTMKGTKMARSFNANCPRQCWRTCSPSTSGSCACVTPSPVRVTPSEHLWEFWFVGLLHWFRENSTLSCLDLVQIYRWRKIDYLMSTFIPPTGSLELLVMFLVKEREAWKRWGNLEV